MQARRGPSLVDVGPSKQRAVLAVLALHAGHAVTAEELQEAVWGPQPPLSGRHLVHTYIARLRQAFEPAVPRRRRLNVIAPAPSGYRLAVDSRHIDVCRFQDLVAQARLQSSADRHRRAFDLLGEAIRLWRDPSLTELEGLLHSSDEIQALRRRWVRAALEYVTAGLKTDSAPIVLATAERMAAAEPLHEEIQAQYLAVLERSGQRALALARFTDIRVRLREQLGVHPGPALAAAHRRLLDGDYGEPDLSPSIVRPMIDIGPVRPPWRGRGPMIGDLIHREADVEALVDILARNRLVTVAGPPGCGKSALALHIAARVRDAFTGGVVVADVSDLSDGTRVARRVLDLLDAEADADVTEVIGDQQLLLVLDNVEHIVDTSALVVDQIVRACPHACVIVTSRERLGLPTEAVWRVHPLAVPAAEELHALVNNPAAALFTQRAMQVQPGFRLHRQNAAAVATICRRLDGLPLALELAAAHLATDTLEGVVRRLDNPLREIRPARRGLPTHHRSLHAALKRSTDCLSAVERHFFERLADVPPEFDLDAVRDGRDTGSADVDAQGIIDKLVDKSLLSFINRPSGPIYRILGVVQHLAAEIRAANRSLGPAPAASGPLPRARRGRCPSRDVELPRRPRWSRRFPGSGPVCRYRPADRGRGRPVGRLASAIARNPVPQGLVPGEQVGRRRSAARITVDRPGPHHPGQRRARRRDQRHHCGPGRSVDLPRSGFRVCPQWPADAFGGSWYGSAPWGQFHTTIRGREPRRRRIHLVRSPRQGDRGRRPSLSGS
ncbi:AfsR/SARP family transcriptional regulator [Phytohabitans suffuscus]|uniref:AfsR/SARP family transcriptional regulator n=1 Tax=Phytohabitans suffuscus TaxID=624315 RepID=UPI0015671E26|nr:BTAD domain-containing putative transcriptional regulator [Phytohabitans suffuscus]